MKDFNPVKDMEDRVALVSKWQDRLETLATRKDNCMTSTVFCLKYGLSLTWLSKAKRIKSLPRWKKINQVEAALKSEGV